MYALIPLTLAALATATPPTPPPASPPPASPPPATQQPGLQTPDMPPSPQQPAAPVPARSLGFQLFVKLVDPSKDLQSPFGGVAGMMLSPMADGSLAFDYDPEDAPVLYVNSSDKTVFADLKNNDGPWGIKVRLPTDDFTKVPYGNGTSLIKGVSGNVAVGSGLPVPALTSKLGNGTWVACSRDPVPGQAPGQAPGQSGGALSVPPPGNQPTDKQPVLPRDVPVGKPPVNQAGTPSPNPSGMPGGQTGNVNVDQSTSLPAGVTEDDFRAFEDWADFSEPVVDYVYSGTAIPPQCVAISLVMSCATTNTSFITMDVPNDAKVLTTPPPNHPEKTLDQIDCLLYPDGLNPVVDDDVMELDEIDLSVSNLSNLLPPPGENAPSKPPAVNKPSNPPANGPSPTPQMTTKNTNANANGS